MVKVTSKLTIKTMRVSIPWNSVGTELVVSPDKNVAKSVRLLLPIVGECLALFSRKFSECVNKVQRHTK